MIKSENGRVTVKGRYPVILTDIACALDALVVETARVTNKTYKEVLEDSISTICKTLPMAESIEKENRP